MIKLVKDKNYESMWRLQWPGGDCSDMYNLTRAHNFLQIEIERLDHA